MEQFDIPVVLFCFKRIETTKRVINVIKQIQPKKFYVLSDAGRNAEENKMVSICRNMIESEVDWTCDFIKYYAKENRGVYKNIGLGAEWVFEREENAIFLEDDCLPDITFFAYCRQLLQEYRQNENVLWICGTNYLEKYNNNYNDDYMFTSHLLPCGWASWSQKFLHYYDAEFKLFTPENLSSVKHTYECKALFKQQIRSIESEINTQNRYGVPTSWDFQMILSLRVNGMYGISPSCNLIRNIGADVNSTHGGTSLNNVMTKRFCEIPTHPISLPLKTNKEVKIDPGYEYKISRIILYPYSTRITLYFKRHLGLIFRKIFRIDSSIRIRDWIGDKKFHGK
jgi:hypothetical protein